MLAAARQSELAACPIDGRIVPLQPIETKNHGIGNGNNAYGNVLRMLMNMKGRDYVVGDEARCNRAIVHRSYRYRLVLQTARHIMSVSKSERDA